MKELYFVSLSVSLSLAAASFWNSKLPASRLTPGSRPGLHVGLDSPTHFLAGTNSIVLYTSLLLASTVCMEYSVL